MMDLNFNSYRRQVLGCFIGKAVGGTLGAPLEGYPGPTYLDYYDPVPQGMVPNDDLDLQVVWACRLRDMPEPVVNADLFTGAWLNHIGFPWDEYAVAIRNLKNGIMPPFSGSYDNYFTDGMGCAIRSEIWACLAPGNPEKAAAMAYEDACVDHDGDGLYAEVFLAAMESAAFSERDIRKIVAAGRKFIPDGLKLGAAIDDAVRWYDEKPDFQYLFEKITGKYRSDNFTDVKINLAIITAALLLGDGDFSRSICHAVGFGEDSDCTGATVGAIMGLLHPDDIPEKWLKPIGKSLVLSREITGLNPPPDLDAFADMLCGMSKKIRVEPKPAESFIKRPAHALYTTRFYDFMHPSTEAGEPDTEVEFDGTRAFWPGDLPKRTELVLRFQFKIDRTGRYAVMFNTCAQSEISVDGAPAFKREMGTMAPSFHRAPWHQLAFMELAAGVHQLEARLQRQPAGRKIEWVIGVADAETMQWIPDAVL